MKDINETAPQKKLIMGPKIIESVHARNTTGAL